MQNVIFTAPVLNQNAIPTILAVLSVPDTNVWLISQDAGMQLPDDIRGALAGYFQVENALDDTQLLTAAKQIQSASGKIHRIFAANEQVQVQVAGIREKLSIEGMNVETMKNFRDKSRMKSILAENSIPCARFRLVTNADAAWLFVGQTGYPVVAKPPEGAGAEFTFKVDDSLMMNSLLAKYPPSVEKPLLLEEFVTGDEFSFDCFTIEGEPQWHSLTRYLPAPLEVKNNPWIQWRVVLPREVDSAEYDDIRSVAFQALKALGARTGISHMEWFRRKDGRVTISEVGMRPPGAQFTTLMSRAHEFDCMGAWAKLMITGKFEPPKRKFASGCAYLRGQGNGVVKWTQGFDTVRKDLGKMITDFRLPETGQKPTGSYEGEGFVIVRHPETKVVEDALLHVVSHVRVWLG